MSPSGRHRFPRRRFTVAAVIFAMLGGGTVYATDSSSGTARAAGGCAAYESVAMGEYWLNNNTWGSDTGTGWSCVWDTSRRGGTIGWGTAYDWAGRADSVKSYASTVLGWHWGWKSRDTGLPVRLTSRTPVRTTWSFEVTEERHSVYNVAYDLWLHDTADPDWQSTPRHEVMIWLARSGGATPIGTKRERVKLAGAWWDLYTGRTSWNVYSFVRVGSTGSADFDLRDFTGALVRRGLVARTDHLSSVEAGTEVFTGKARLDTSAYSTTVG